MIDKGLILVLLRMTARVIQFCTGTLKINVVFEDIYNIFGDGNNLVSFVSFASTAGYSTNAGIVVPQLIQEFQSFR